ncbi:DASH family cryptochrome [Pedobacter sp. JY14-1]|uniref:DASH family cryptochrome n=1 Tax=Pedobacter sp. JY14-1 TaxID=3034151 RepID=UPI0023E266DB|nr:DASH family cryptochrome [Pedobacter sp. JY14-1]
MKSRRILVWFRNDLRLHDNEMLVEAIAKSERILPVYFFDPRYFEITNFDTLKTGIQRSRFLIESVRALRTAFQRFSGDILLVKGRPEDHILNLTERFEISEVYHHREVGPEETAISAAVEDALWKQKINLRHFIGHTLYNKEDLPFPIRDIPDVFSQFKKKTERDAVVKACFDTPEKISFVENEEWGVLPGPEDLGFGVEESVPDALQGGEAAGLAHLEELLTPSSVIYYKPSGKTGDKNGFSSRLSAWLSLGCLSPRMVYWKFKAAEERIGGNANFNQVLLGLLWRDYYRFMFKKHGIRFFREPGLEILVQEPEMPDSREVADWKAGNTGNALVDRYMRELNNTGFIPHAARLVVATFLVHVAGGHWTKGAAYFEEKLLDYSPASNWGNWANIAGTGLGAGHKGAFDIEKQIKLLETAAAESTSVA